MLKAKKNKKKIKEAEDKVPNTPEIKSGFLTAEKKRDMGVQALRWAMLSPNFAPDAYRYGKRVGGVGVKLVNGVDRGARVAWTPFYNLYRIIWKGEKPGVDGEYVDENSPAVAHQFMRGELTTEELEGLAVTWIHNNHLATMLFSMASAGFLVAVSHSVGWSTLFGIGVLMLCGFAGMLKSWSAIMKILTNRNYSPLKFLLYFVKQGKFSMMLPVIVSTKRIDKRIRFLEKKKNEKNKGEKQ